MYKLIDDNILFFILDVFYYEFIKWFWFLIEEGEV